VTATEPGESVHVPKAPALVIAPIAVTFWSMLTSVHVPNASALAIAPMAVTFCTGGVGATATVIAPQDTLVLVITPGSIEEAVDASHEAPCRMEFVFPMTVAHPEVAAVNETDEPLKAISIHSQSFDVPGLFNGGSAFVDVVIPA
jgi:hypothetical protein